MQTDMIVIPLDGYEEFQTRLMVSIGMGDIGKGDMVLGSTPPDSR